MKSDELERIGEIDRSERITQQYVAVDGRLTLIDVDIDASPWGGPREAPLQRYLDQWRPLLDRGVMLGAFDGDHLAGFAIYTPSGERGFAQLSVLHVSRPYRRTGVGRHLTNEVLALARHDSATRLYVSATPTRGTVDFYTKCGFKPVASPDPELFALEPDDIHLDMRP
jgi:GNAT superfamily N-acetyltransferase